MPIDPLRLAVAALAAYRLSRLLAFEEGPGGVFDVLRGAMGGKVIDEETGQPATSLGRIAVCPYCWGVWVALVLSLLVLFPSWAGDFFLLVLGLAGAQAYLQGTSD